MLEVYPSVFSLMVGGKNDGSAACVSYVVRILCRERSIFASRYRHDVVLFGKQDDPIEEGCKREGYSPSLESRGELCLLDDLTSTRRLSCCGEA